MSTNVITKQEIVKQASKFGVGLVLVLLISLSIPVILTLVRYNKCKDEADENTKRNLQYLRYSLTIITTILVTTIARAVGGKLDLVAIAVLSAIIGFFNFFLSFNLLKKEKCSSVNDSDKKFMNVTTYVNSSLVLVVILGLIFLAENRDMLPNI